MRSAHKSGPFASPSTPIHPNVQATEGSLSRDPDRGGYVVQYRLNGRPKKARGKTPRDAYAKRDEQIAAAAEEREVAKDGPVLSAALALFLEGRGVKAQSTLDHHREGVARLIATVGDKPIAEVTALDCEAVLSRMARAGRMASTLGLWRKAVNPLFRWAVKHGMMTTNPLADIRVADYGAPKSPKPRFYEVHEADQLTKHLAADLTEEHVAALVMLWAGLRAGETAGLEWDAIDWPTSAIRVYQQTTTDALGITDVLKTDASYRVLPYLPAALMEPLAEWRALRPEGRFVCAADGAPMMTDRRVQEALKRITRRNGLRYVNPHGLRHTAGSMVYKATGGDIPKTAAFLGHDKYAGVTFLYVHDVASGEPIGPLLDALREGRLTPART